MRAYVNPALAPILGDSPNVSTVILAVARQGQRVQIKGAPIMNRFGRQAQLAWQELAPTAYAAIERPEEHFTELGERAEQAWLDLWPQLVDPNIPVESPLGKVGQINAARTQADEIIRADWLTPSADEQEPDEGDEPSPFGAAMLAAYREAMVAERSVDPIIYGEFPTL